MFGIVRNMVFIVAEVKARAVQVVGIHIAPDGAWFLQMARNLREVWHGFPDTVTTERGPHPDGGHSSQPLARWAP